MHIIISEISDSNVLIRAGLLLQNVKLNMYHSEIEIINDIQRLYIMIKEKDFFS
jgi:hypothetical protein